MEILEFCRGKLREMKVDKLELCWERASNLSVEIHDGKLDHLTRATDQGLAIRCLKEGRMGFSYTLDLTRGAVERAAQTAVEVASLMPSDPHHDLGGFEAKAFPERWFDAAGLEEPLEAKIERARELEAATLARDPRVKRARKAAYEESAGETALMDTAGTMIRSRHTLFAAEITCVAEDASGSTMGSDARYATRLGALDWDATAREAADGALELLSARSAPTMTCPAVFKSSVVAELMGFLSASFSAENIDKGLSLLADKKGARLFSPAITIVDDGGLAGGAASEPFDGEGTPTRAKTLVDQGTITGFLYDSYYGRKRGQASTGNSRRAGLKQPPSIGPTNFYLKAGDLAREDLIRQAGRGVYVTEVMGMHTANPVTGEFSFGASGLLIENGGLARPVKGFAIAGTLAELLSTVNRVGSDLRFWGGIGAPSLLVERLAVSGSA